MRQLPVLAISAAVHAALILAMTAGSHERPPARPRPPAPIIELVEPPAPTPDVPVDVVLLDEAATAALAATDEAPSTTPREDAPQVAAIEPRRGASTGEPRAAAGTDGGDGGDGGDRGTGTTPGRNPWLDMRKGRPVRLTTDVPTPRRDGRDRPLDTYGPDIDSGQLRPAGGGTYRSDQGPFTAKVGADGSVSLKDKRNLNVRFALPGPKAFGRMIADWYTGPKPTEGPQRVTRIGGDPVTSDGSERVGAGQRMPDPSDGGTLPILSGGFDITDAFMRGKGQDPYASKKLQFLDSTRDQRVQIGMRHRQRQLDQVTLLMQRNLDRAWATLATDRARLRTALFELWDECAETGSEDLVRAGRAARTLVIGFIRGKLPAGSAEAYSAAELAALNRRRQSTATFAPYE